MSHITKTREEVLNRGTFNENEGTFTFDAITLKDALLDLYTKAFGRGVDEYLENFDKRMGKANETI